MTKKYILKLKWSN